MSYGRRRWFEAGKGRIDPAAPFHLLVKGSGVAAGIAGQAVGTELDRFTPEYKRSVEANSTYALVSAASYLYAKSPEQTEAFLSKTLPGFKIDHYLSSGDHLVVYNSDTRKAILGYRGTDPWDAKDVAADIRLAGEGWDHEGDERFDAATDQFKQFQRMYHPFDITVTGHSLGGSQAMWVGTQNPLVRTVIFNAGVVTPTGAQALRSTLGVDDGMGKPLNNVTLLRADGDVVSGGWMAYNNPEELKDDQGRGLVASKDPQTSSALVKGIQAMAPDRWVHQYKHGNGMKLVNIKGKDGSSSHSLNNFLTDDQARRLEEAQALNHVNAEPKTISHEPPISPPAHYQATPPVDIPKPIGYHSTTDFRVLGHHSMPQGA
jgi:hypothetical protein